MNYLYHLITLVLGSEIYIILLTFLLYGNSIEMDLLNLPCGMPARGIRKLHIRICDLIVTNRIDILYMTETWVSNNESHSISTLTNSLQDYHIICLARYTRRGFSSYCSQRL